MRTKILWSLLYNVIGILIWINIFAPIHTYFLFRTLQKNLENRFVTPKTLSKCFALAPVYPPLLFTHTFWLFPYIAKRNALPFLHPYISHLRHGLPIHDKGLIVIESIATVWLRKARLTLVLSRLNWNTWTWWKIIKGDHIF